MMTTLSDFTKPHPISIEFSFGGVSAKVKEIPGLYIYVTDPKDFQHKLQYGIKELFKFRSVIGGDQDFDLRLEDEKGVPIDDPDAINPESKTFFRILEVTK